MVIGSFAANSTTSWVHGPLCEPSRVVWRL
jgi:hypothetical protein